MPLASPTGSGEIQWRSRKPGDGFPTLVGEHLVIITKPGGLHVVEATPEARGVRIGWEASVRRRRLSTGRGCRLFSGAQYC